MSIVNISFIPRKIYLLLYLMEDTDITIGQAYFRYIFRAKLSQKERFFFCSDFKFFNQYDRLKVAHGNTVTEETFSRTLSRVIVTTCGKTEFLRSVFFFLIFSTETILKFIISKHACMFSFICVFKHTVRLWICEIKQAIQLIEWYFNVI